MARFGSARSSNFPDENQIAAHVTSAFCAAIIASNEPKAGGSSCRSRVS